MRYKGMIFDFNGVLLWDTELHDEAWRAYSKKLRGNELTDEEMLNFVHGRPNSAIFEYILEKPSSQAELEEHTQSKESIYRSLCLKLGDQFILSPGAVLFLDFLKASNIPRTIATASEITNLQFFFKHLNLGNWFNFENVVFDDGTFPGKPFPDIYLKASEKLDLPPETCVVVEDSRSGLKAAHAAKIGRVIALGPTQMHRQLQDTDGVDAVVSQLSELIDMNLFNDSEFI